MVNAVAYFLAAVAAVMVGPEKALGLFWQSRVLGYIQLLSGD